MAGKKRKSRSGHGALAGNGEKKVKMSEDVGVGGEKVQKKEPGKSDQGKTHSEKSVQKNTDPGKDTQKKTKTSDESAVAVVKKKKKKHTAGVIEKGIEEGHSETVAAEQKKPKKKSGEPDLKGTPKASLSSTKAGVQKENQHASKAPRSNDDTTKQSTTKDTVDFERASVENLVKHLQDEPHFPPGYSLDVSIVKRWMAALETGSTKRKLYKKAPMVLKKLQSDAGVTAAQARAWLDTNVHHHHRHPVIVHPWVKYRIPISKGKKAEASNTSACQPVESTSVSRATKPSPEPAKTSSQTILTSSAASDSSDPSSDDDSDNSSCKDDGEEWNGFSSEESVVSDEEDTHSTDEEPNTSNEETEADFQARTNLAAHQEIADFINRATHGVDREESTPEITTDEEDLPSDAFSLEI